MELSQRAFSPARPVTSFSARSSLLCRSASSSSRAFLFAVLSSYCDLRAWTAASTSASLDWAVASCACFFARLSWAALSLALLGPTIFATSP